MRFNKPPLPSSDGWQNLPTLTCCVQRCAAIVAVCLPAVRVSTKQEGYDVHSIFPLSQLNTDELREDIEQG